MSDLAGTLRREASKVEARLFQGSFAAGVSFLLSIGQVLVQVPLLLKFWSVEEYGAWLGIAAAVSIVTALDLGHQNYLGNQFNRYWIEDKNKLKITLASGLLVAFGIATLEFLAGVFIVIFGKLSWLSLKPTEFVNQDDIKLAFIAYLLFWVCSGSFGGVLVRLYQPAGFFARSQWIGIATRLAGFFALVLSVALGCGIVGAMMAQIIAWSVCTIGVLYDLYKKLPSLYPWWFGIDLATAWRHFRYSLILTFNSICEQVSGSGLVLLVGAILAPIEVAIFATLRTVANTALQGISVILQPVIPDLVRYHISSESKKILAVLQVAWMLGCSCICLFFVAAFPLVKPFYELWTLKSLKYDDKLFALVASAVIVRQWASPLLIYISGINILKPQVTAVLLRAFFSLAISAIMMKSYGVIAAGIGLLAGEIFSGVILFIAVQKTIHAFDGCISLASILLPISQMVLAMGAFFLAVKNVDNMLINNFIISIAIVFAGYFQFLYLDADVKERFYVALTRYTKIL